MSEPTPQTFTFKCKPCVKIIESGLFFNLIFLLFLYLYFIFLEQLGLGLEVISHNINYETWENEVEGSRTNDISVYIEENTTAKKLISISPT